MENEPKACAAVKGTQIMVKLSNLVVESDLLFMCFEFCVFRWRICSII